jgi:hypothetical protein
MSAETLKALVRSSTSRLFISSVGTPVTITVPAPVDVVDADTA